MVDEFCPGFSQSVIGPFDALSPLDLQRVFGLEQGSIIHGARAPPAGLYPHLPGLQRLLHPGGQPVSTCAALGYS